MFRGGGKKPPEPPSTPPSKPTDPRVTKLLDDMEIIVKFIKILDIQKFKSNIEEFSQLLPSVIKISSNLLAQKEEVERKLAFTIAALEESEKKIKGLEIEARTLQSNVRKMKIYIFVIIFIFVITALYLGGFIKMKPF